MVIFFRWFIWIKTTPLFLIFKLQSAPGLTSGLYSRRNELWTVTQLVVSLFLTFQWSNFALFLRNGME